METKVCTVCDQDKPLDQYRKYSGRGRNGLRPLCKICQREYEKKWRSRSTESLKECRSRRAEKQEIYSRQWRIKNRASYLIAGAKIRSLKKGMEFDLDQHVQALQKRISVGFCELSGIALDLNAQPGRRFNAPSLDKIDPSKGYVISNVRIVAFAVNAMLGDWGEKVALQIMQAWITKESI